MLRMMTDPQNSKADVPRVTDQTLIRRFREGQEDAASELYLRYAKRLQSLARNQTSRDLAVRTGPEDIIQSVFRTFFRRVSNGQYEVIGGDDLWRLFLVIALNKIRSAAEFHRAQKRDVRRTATADNGLLQHIENSSDDKQVALSILQLTIDEILSRFPVQNRQVIRLRIEGYSVAQIAEETKRAKRSVERVLQDFRRQLMSEIGDDDGN